MREWDIGAVVHLAGFISVAESVRCPEKYHKNNVEGSARLLDAALAAGVLHFVFSSSAAVYGPPQVSPIPEDHPTRPASPYGDTKVRVEAMLQAHGSEHGLRWMSLRMFNAAGAARDGELGERHVPETHLVPLALLGTDYDTPDGTPVRDYVHVEDLADAHARAVRRLLGGGASATVNLGSGIGHSVREVLRTVEAITGRRVPIRIGPRRDGDPPVLVADASRARALLGWQAQRSRLEEIVESALRFHERAGF